MHAKFTATTTNVLAPFRSGSHKNSFIYNARLPRTSELLASSNPYETLRVEYQEAFYGDEKDVPKVSRSYGGREFKLKSKRISDLPEFDPVGEMSSLKGHEGPQAKPSFKFWQVAAPPPSRKEVVKWLKEQKKDKGKDHVQKTDPNGLDCFSQVGLNLVMFTASC